jgi:8-oxo-dGTP diphosphatase
MRKRATVLLCSDNKILLVMDKGHHKWSLPGGGVKHGEESYVAAKRELKEELGITVGKLSWLGHVGGIFSRHSIFVTNTFEGHIHIKDGELKKYFWWDGKDHLDVYEHVYAALKLAKGKFGIFNQG